MMSNSFLALEITRSISSMFQGNSAMYSVDIDWTTCFISFLSSRESTNCTTAKTIATMGRKDVAILDMNDAILDILFFQLLGSATGGTGTRVAGSHTSDHVASVTGGVCRAGVPIANLLLINSAELGSAR